MSKKEIEIVIPKSVDLTKLLSDKQKMQIYNEINSKIEKKYVLPEDPTEIPAMLDDEKNRLLFNYLRRKINREQQREYYEKNKDIVKTKAKERYHKAKVGRPRIE